MDKISKIFFYKRNSVKNVSMLRNIKNLKIGDIITFYGKLYDSDKYSKQLAKTIIQYKILSISTKGVLIETSNKYIFNAGTLHFMGNIFSSNFDIEDNIVHSYSVKSSILSFVNGTKKFRNAFGYIKYKIIKNGLGEIKMNLELVK
jgi:hypothetical protein